MTLKELWHRLGSPRWFYRISGPLAWVLGILALVLENLAFQFTHALVVAEPFLVQRPEILGFLLQ